jgi:hypothetical protein
LVVIRVWTFCMEESGNGSNDNAGEQEDGGQPQCIPRDSPDGRLTDH